MSDPADWDKKEDQCMPISESMWRLLMEEDVADSAPMTKYAGSKKSKGKKKGK